MLVKGAETGKSNGSSEAGLSLLLTEKKAGSAAIGSEPTAPSATVVRNRVRQMGATRKTSDE